MAKHKSDANMSVFKLKRDPKLIVDMGCSFQKGRPRKSLTG
ncbi:MAG: hypothetical protein QG552_2221 [Thermodesulfobacteriota bacterium]|nr:hypothetical protein [Thermodesulfobacteriota bacterium]